MQPRDQLPRRGGVRVAAGAPIQAVQLCYLPAVRKPIVNRGAQPAARTSVDHGMSDSSRRVLVSARAGLDPSSAGALHQRPCPRMLGCSVPPHVGEGLVRAPSFDETEHRVRGGSVPGASSRTSRSFQAGLPIVGRAPNWLGWRQPCRPGSATQAMRSHD